MNKYETRQKQVVITGVGVAISSAIGKNELRDIIYKKANKILITSEKLDQIATEYFGADACRRMDDYCKYGVIAAKLAMDDSEIMVDKINESRVGAVLSTVWGPFATTYKYFKDVLEKGPAQASPFLFPNTVTNAAVGKVARLLGLKGVSSMLIGCCPINYSFDLIKTGKADIILAGGIDNTSLTLGEQESHIHEVNNSLEGACVLVLEDKGHALKRNAKILAEIKSCSSGNIQTEDNSENIKSNFSRIIENVLKSANIPIENIFRIISMNSENGQIEKIEENMLTKMFNSNWDKTRIHKPLKGIGNPWGILSTLNLYAALLETENEEFIAINKNNNQSFIISNSLFYGGSFNSILISRC